MIPNCDLSRENLSAGFSTRSDINQHVKQTLKISDLESREVLISKNKGLCNELIFIFEPLFAYAETKAQISFAITAKLISAFVFATWKV